jgi:hypothetical protein
MKLLLKGRVIDLGPIQILSSYAHETYTAKGDGGSIILTAADCDYIHSLRRQAA